MEDVYVSIKKGYIIRFLEEEKQFTILRYNDENELIELTPKVTFDKVEYLEKEENFYGEKDGETYTITLYGTIINNKTNKIY